MIGKISKKVLNGESITFEEANILIKPSDDLAELVMVAKTLTQRNFNNKMNMCAIYPAKIGLCSSDCAFCAQSIHHSCKVKVLEVKALNEEEIIANGKMLWRLGVNRLGLVTCGERLTDMEFASILDIFRRLYIETKIGLCASLGSLTLERVFKLIEVGVVRYHHNIETSSSYFPNICTTHSYDDRIKTINLSGKAGMEVCSGGIIGLGESPEQRVEMVFALKKLDVDCIPINILNPIPGTKLEDQEPLRVNEILRTLAVFRLILPEKTLTFAGGREKALGAEEYKGYEAGTNSLLVGNYLTTQGRGAKETLENLKSLGYDILQIPLR